MLDVRVVADVVGSCLVDGDGLERRETATAEVAEHLVFDVGGRRSFRHLEDSWKWMDGAETRDE
jgi:hypothetical protein